MLEFLTKPLFDLGGFTVLVWHVAAVAAALILLIVIIAVCASASRKKKAAKAQPAESNQTVAEVPAPQAEAKAEEVKEEPDAGQPAKQVEQPVAVKEEAQEQQPDAEEQAKAAEAKKDEPAKEEPEQPAVKEEPEQPAAKDEPAKEAAKTAKPAKKPAEAKKPVKKTEKVEDGVKVIEEEGYDDEEDEPTDKTAKRPKNYHVSLRADNRWQVKLSKGGKAIKLFNTQAEAIAFAKERAKSQDGYITIHKVDGKIRKQRY